MSWDISCNSTSQLSLPTFMDEKHWHYSQFSVMCRVVKYSSERQCGRHIPLQNQVTHPDGSQDNASCLLEGHLLIFFLSVLHSLWQQGNGQRVCMSELRVKNRGPEGVRKGGILACLSVLSLAWKGSLWPGVPSRAGGQGRWLLSGRGRKRAGHAGKNEWISSCKAIIIFMPFVLFLLAVFFS